MNLTSFDKTTEKYLPLCTKRLWNVSTFTTTLHIIKKMLQNHSFAENEQKTMNHTHFVCPFTKTFCLVSFLLLLLHIGCNETDTPDTPDDLQIDMTKIPLPKLSDYGFFDGNIADMKPVEELIPYDLITPLFSNYAQKARFVYVPKGKKVIYKENDVFDFPIGSIIVKTFYFYNDINDPSQGKQILETRLLIKTDTAWLSAPYIWNEQQTDANYDVAGRIVDVTWTHTDGNPKTIFYQIPNSNECRGCHSLDKKTELIGPKARHLNHNFPYATGSMNQLDKWTQSGILQGAPPTAQVPRVAQWNDPNSGTLDQRTRAYLDINCAHCHNSQGPANNSGLDLNYFQTDSTALGICKQPVAAGQGSGNFDFGIVPGKPEESIMIYRMNSIQPQIAMPELARSVIHDEGVELVRQWIASLPGSCD